MSFSFRKFIPPSFLLLAALFALSGCASYQKKVSEPYGRMLEGRYADAANLLRPKAIAPGDDQLVYMLEYGMALHLAGQYKESTQVFLQAYEMVEIKDFHSLSKITGSLLLSDTLIQYKGEDFEKVMINAYLALNFLMMDELDSALVEARRINNILEKFRQEAKRPYEQNPFARYLSAILWEASRSWDSMYIDYNNTHDLNPAYSPLSQDLIWAAKRANRPEELKKWQKQWPEVKPPKERGDKAHGELIFIYQQGQGPQKRPNPGFPRVPQLTPRFSSGVSAEVLVAAAGTAPANSVRMTTDKIFDLEQVSIKNLDDQYAELVAKRAAGIVAKAVVSDQIRQKNQALGDIAWILMNIADQADLRQWSSLPASFQIARIWLKPGKYMVSAKSLSGGGQPAGEVMNDSEVVIVAGKKKFLTWRSFR